MRLRRLGTALTALLSATALAVVGAGQAVGTPKPPPVTTLYASPSGQDPLCLRVAPCSIEQAQHLVRLVAPVAPGDVVVTLAGGTYSLTKPLEFTAADSGEHGHTVRWVAAAGQTPVISGGVPVSGWQATSDTGVFSAKVPADLDTRQLYADGVRVPRAGGALPVGMTQTATGFTTADATMASWRNPQDIEFVLDMGHGAWTQPRCGVASISGTTITMDQPCWDNMKLLDFPKAANGDNPSGGFPTYPSDAVPTRVENAYELLTPGSWYLDQTKHVLYYKARAGENPKSMHFIAPKLQNLVHTTTTYAKPLHDVSFEGLDFAYATWLAPSSPDGFVEMQANYTLTGPGASKTQGLCQYVQPAGTCPFASYTREPAAVDLTGTQHVSFLRNTFNHLGAAGLGFQHGILDDLVQGNTVTDVSGIGILLGAVDDPLPLNGDQREIATGNTIDDNYVHDTGVEYEGAPAIVNGYSRQTTITHNEIAHVPYSGISSGYGGWHTDSERPDENPNINADNTISYNTIYADMQNHFDGGFVYTNGSQGKSYEHGLTVVGNVMFAGGRTSFAVYNDEGSSYVTIDGNVQYDDTGNLNGGCSSIGHIRVKGNFHVGAINQLICAPAAVDGEDLGGNQLVSSDLTPGVVPSGVFEAAGLRPAYQYLTTSRAPEVVAASSTCTSDILISGSGFTPDAKVSIGGKALTPVTYEGTNHLAVTLPPGSTGGAVTVTTKAGSSAASVKATTGLCGALSSQFDNVGITSDDNTGPGNVDGSGYSFSAQALAAQGFTPGALISHDGVNFTWPTASAGSADNALAAGQTVGLIGSSSTLGLLVTSTYPSSGTGTVNYTDGTTQKYTVTLPNWADSVPSDVDTVVTTPYRNGPGGQDGLPVHINYVGVPIDASKTVRSVQLPLVGSQVGAGVPAMHVFAVGLAGTQDLALGKPATSSSVAFDGAPGRAVDGDTNGVYFNNSLSHTGLDAQAWWQVDLGATGPVSTINVWNRTDCCSERLDDFWVFVSSTPFDTSLTPAEQAAQPGVWSSHQTGDSGEVTTVRPNTQGRYVMVQLNGTNYLALAEVQVFALKGF